MWTSTSPFPVVRPKCSCSVFSPRYRRKTPVLSPALQILISVCTLSPASYGTGHTLYSVTLHKIWRHQHCGGSWESAHWDPRYIAVHDGRAQKLPSERDLTHGYPCPAPYCAQNDGKNASSVRLAVCTFRCFYSSYVHSFQKSYVFPPRPVPR